MGAGVERPVRALPAERLTVYWQAVVVNLALAGTGITLFVTSWPRTAAKRMGLWVPPSRLELVCGVGLVWVGWACWLPYPCRSC